MSSLFISIVQLRLFACLCVISLPWSLCLSSLVQDFVRLRDSVANANTQNTTFFELIPNEFAQFCKTFCQQAKERRKYELTRTCASTKSIKLHHAMCRMQCTANHVSRLTIIEHVPRPLSLSGPFFLSTVVPSVLSHKHTLFQVINNSDLWPLTLINERADQRKSI